MSNLELLSGGAVVIGPRANGATFLILQETATWWDSMLQLLQAGSIIGAACMAIWGISAWRREMIGRKRADLAEHVLAAFFQAKDILISVRSPFSFGNEGKSRPRSDDEVDDRSSILDSYFVPIERLERHNEFFAKMEASKYRFAALFGETAGCPFQEVNAVRGEIRFAAIKLIRHQRRLGSRHQVNEKKLEEIDELEQIIWWSGAESDALHQRLENATISIKEICQPILADRSFLANRRLSTWLRFYRTLRMSVL